MGKGALLTQMRMEKKEKVMAALALLLPRRKYLGGERCHWLARKQNPTAQMPAQMTGGSRERRGAGWGGGRWAQEGWGLRSPLWPLPPSPL